MKIRVLLLLLVLVAGCRRSSPQPIVAEEAGPPVVKVGKPVKGAVRRIINQPGHNVEAYRHAPLYARVPGYVEEVKVDIGATVKKGDTLVILSAPELDADLKSKEAALKQAGAEVEQAEKNLLAAKASVDSARAFIKQAEAAQTHAKAEQSRATAQLTRMTRAGQGGVIDREAVAEVRYTSRAADAAVLEAAAKVTSARALAREAEAKQGKAAADVAVTKAKVEVAQAARDHAKSLRDFRFIKAPFAGVVTARTTDVGHFVQPAGQAKAHSLVTIDRKDRMRLFVHLPETEARFIIHDQKANASPGVEVRAAALGGKVLKGSITRSAFALDPKTRTLRTEIDLPNDHGLLRPGMYVHTRITIEHDKVWTLPTRAIQRDGAEVFCFVVHRSKARKMLLEVGLEDGKSVEVRQRQAEGKWSEIDGTEDVILNPPVGLKDGDPVQ